MAYEIPLSDFAKAHGHSGNPNVERAVKYLVERMGINLWQKRKAAIESFFVGLLRLDVKNIPPEGISLRYKADEIAWYIYVGESSIGAPEALESNQASRILPILDAFGSKLESILRIENITERIDRMLRPVANQDPDQAFFEILIGAAYVREGWERQTGSPDSCCADH